MQFLIILLCAALSCTKVTTQGHLSKGNINNSTDSVLANCLVFAFTFVIFSVSVLLSLKFFDIILFKINILLFKEC